MSAASSGSAAMADNKILDVWYGMCFRKDKTTEVESILGMQSMTATVASLISGILAGKSTMHISGMLGQFAKNSAFLM